MNCFSISVALSLSSHVNSFRQLKLSLRQLLESDIIEEIVIRAKFTAFARVQCMVDCGVMSIFLRHLNARNEYIEESFLLAAEKRAEHRVKEKHVYWKKVQSINCEQYSDN